MTPQQYSKLYHQTAFLKRQTEELQLMLLKLKPKKLNNTLLVKRNRFGEGFDVINSEGVVLAFGFDSEEEAIIHAAALQHL